MKLAVAAMIALAPEVVLGPCLDALQHYAAWQEDAPHAWSLDLTGRQNARLVLMGAEHSDDPKHAQFKLVDEAWQAVRPAIAFYEGPDRGLEPSAEKAIRVAGESGYVRFLANRDHIPARSLEPDPAGEVAHLRKTYSEEQIVLFFCLREAVRLRDRKKLDPKTVEARIGELLQRARGRGLFGGAIEDVNDLKAAYARHWKTPVDPWQVPERWFGPVATGQFTNDINRALSEYRNVHMAALLVTAAREHGRVFALVGGNHVPMQSPAIQCALAGDGFEPTPGSKLNRVYKRQP